MNVDQLFDKMTEAAAAEWSVIIEQKGPAATVQKAIAEEVGEFDTLFQGLYAAVCALEESDLKHLLLRDLMEAVNCS